jgi:hypothetical protein
MVAEKGRGIVFYYYGNDALVGFEVDPQGGELTVGTIWREGDGEWHWAALPDRSCAASVAWGGDYDYVPPDKVEAMQRLSEKTRAERRKELEAK